MKTELLHMSKREQSRTEVIRLYIEGHIKQKSAAKRIGLSVRQVRRLTKAYRQKRKGSSLVMQHFICKLGVLF
jgi:predicted DNA-binding protein (UPF0251 family)